MTGNDLLKYNYRDLLNLATRGNRTQKEWLETYLETCDNNAEKRRLLAALAKKHVHPNC
jgi:hypothetical protein